MSCNPVVGQYYLWRMTELHMITKIGKSKSPYQEDILVTTELIWRHIGSYIDYGEHCYELNFFEDEFDLAEMDFVNECKAETL